jgi:hypothetical protein
MDERQRLLERVYSREGAAERPREYRHPVTGEVVSMTPSQWDLAQYDARHATAAGRVTEAEDDSATLHDDSETAADVSGWDGQAPERADGRGAASSRSKARRRAMPYLAGAGGLALGALLVLGVEGMLGASGPTSADSVSTHSARPFVGSGDGDAGATLAAVTEYFAKAPRVDNLPPEVTHGFDPTSFHPVAGGASFQQSSAIYAARRLGDQYCLVAVTSEARAAETCGTIDDIARRGLTLTKDVVRDIDGRPMAVTVLWQTDGTITWDVAPSAG